MEKTLKQDDALMKSLNLVTINRLICYTDKGMLTLQIRKGDNQYHLCLDSVPVDKQLNKELMELLFPVKPLEVPQVKKEPQITWNGEPIASNSKNAKQLKALDAHRLPKKIGRPVGAKSGKRTE